MNVQIYFSPEVITPHFEVLNVVDSSAKGRWNGVFAV